MVIKGLGVLGEFPNSDRTHNHDFLFLVTPNSDMCTFRYTIETPKFNLKSLILTSLT